MYSEMSGSGKYESFYFSTSSSTLSLTRDDHGGVSLAQLLACARQGKEQDMPLKANPEFRLLKRHLEFT